MKNPIKVLEPNVKGRDFVIGDLHGSFSCLTNLLHNLKFNPAVDRVISVGDLVDRGPESLECLHLLTQPWFHAVLANHEQLMLAAFNGENLGQYWYPNGGNWGAQAILDWNTAQIDYRFEPPAESRELHDLLPYVKELPFLITIKQLNGTKFHVLHAEFPPGSLGITDDDLSSPEKVMKLATTFDGHNGDSFLWSRFIFSQYSRLNLSNVAKIKRSIANKFKNSSGPFNAKLSPIISGHTILQQPMTIFGQTNIDTGAYGSYDEDAASWNALTCIELGTWKFYQATETEFREVEPITINQETLNSAPIELTH